MDCFNRIQGNERRKIKFVRFIFCNFITELFLLFGHNRTIKDKGEK